MVDDPADEHIDPIVHEVISARIRRLSQKLCLSDADLPDVAQHVYEKLLPHFELGCKTSPRGSLLERVIDNALANYVRDRQARKRQPGRLVSLSIVVDVLDDQGAIELSETLGEREHLARLQLHRRSYQSRIDLLHDLEAVMAKLSSFEREICEGLMHQSVKELSRVLRQPRTTIHNHIRRLRQVFEDAGLREYL